MRQLGRKTGKPEIGAVPPGFGEARQAAFRHDAVAAALVSLVARESGVPLRLILHRERCRAGVAAARHLAMYLMHVALGRSITEVAQFFGRDRSTVAYALVQIEDRRDGQKFDAEVCRLEDLIARFAGGEARHGGH